MGHWKVYLTIKKGDKLTISSNNETDADAEKDMFLKNGVAYHRLLAPSMTNILRGKPEPSPWSTDKASTPSTKSLSSQSEK